MKLSDELLLKSLRADVLSGVADDHWDLVCKAVDDAGDIRDVRGYARTVIFDAIEKFNPNHDQLGQFATGGAGGAGRSGGNQWDGVRPSSSDIDAEMQNLSAENKAILMNSMRFEEGSREFRLSNPYRANTTKVLITNLQMAQESTAPKTKEPFLDTTDIEPDMGSGISAGRKAQLGKKYPNAGMVVDLPSPTGQRTSEETARIVRNIAAARAERKKK